MSTGRMRIIYHPVLKEMRFKRYENGRWVEAGDEKSVLGRYVNAKDLLLQNLGNEFFQDISKSADRITDLVLEFEGTREDYEDLKKMVEYYKSMNKDAHCQISVGDLIELPAVKSLFNEVMRYSSETSGAFQRMVDQVNQEGHGKEVGSICDKLEDWLEDLERTREGLKSDVVNLCFIGAYSSGKSTLISALIGESILPEAIKAETAKMFQITQIPKDSADLPSISFCLMKDSTRHQVKLQWDEQRQTFRFIDWPVENPIREAVQCALNENEGRKRHVQLKAVLSVLNMQPDKDESLGENGEIQYNNSYIKGIVDVRYPFDIDTNVLLRIYDTPGTDSDNPAHEETLREALQDPASSILVYVNEPAKLAGVGNRTLLSILNSLESGELANGTTIDLGRSFFVINRADTVKDEKAIRDVQDGVLRLKRIGEEEEGKAPLEIRLREKRLFFTDALHAGDAKAVQKDIAEDDELNRLEKNKKLVNTPWYRFYQYNIMAQAEAETKHLAERTEAALAEALPDPKAWDVEAWAEGLIQATQQGDEAAFRKAYPAPSRELPLDAYYICSGVYTLQKEIERYVERYALAVRTKGIIDGTRALIGHLDTRCRQVENDLTKNVEDLEEQIKVSKGELSRKINSICEFKDKTILSPDEEKALGLDLDALQDRTKTLERKLNNMSATWGLIGNKALEDSIRSAKAKTKLALDQFFNGYAANSEACLERTQRDLMKKIEEAIDAQKGLDQEFKERLKKVRTSKIPKPTQIASGIETEEFLASFLFIQWVKKDELIEKLTTPFGAELYRLADEYKTAYRNTRQELAGTVQAQYLERIDEVAGEIFRLKTERDKVIEELNTVKEIVENASRRYMELEDKIYNRKPKQEAQHG